MRLAWMIYVCLCLQIASCTKKKPADAAPSMRETSTAAAIPQDTTHAKFPLTAQPSGEIRAEWQASPSEIAQMKVFEEEAKSFAGLKSKSASGLAIFKIHCATCHGPEGRGNGPGGDALPVIPTNFHEWPIKYGRLPKELALTISSGRNDGVMPAFSAMLKKEELWSLVWLISGWIEARADQQKTQP